jgi:hypothetical protein
MISLTILVVVFLPTYHTNRSRIGKPTSVITLV